MSTRRQLLQLAPFVFLLTPQQAQSDGGADWAAEFIRRIGNEIADVAGSPAPVNERRQRLQSLVDRVADVDDAARFCLGRFWRQASHAQQSEYVTLFHTVLMKVVLSRINAELQSRSEVRVTISHPEVRQDGVYVPTVVARTGNPPVQVTWLVSADASHPRLLDVIAEGTSLRLTVRSDYNAFLMRHDNNIDALLQALRDQACDTCAPASSSAVQ
jgi:phospholipid transport system substrate-binding protein